MFYFRKKSETSSRASILVLVGIALVSLLDYQAKADGMATGNKNSSDSLSNYINQVRYTIIGRYGLRFDLDKNGIPTRIEGDLSKGITATEPTEKAYQFFELNKDIFQMVSPREELPIRQVIREERSTVKFYWAINGVKVQYGGYFMHFSKSGSPYSVEGRIYPEARKVDTKPVISEEQAKQIVVDDTKKFGTTLENTKSAELIIIRADSLLCLAWDVHISKLDSVLIDSDYYVDAKTGAILDKKTRIRD